MLYLPSIAQLQQSLRIAVWQESLQRLANRPKHPTLARKIKELFQYDG